MVLPFVFVTENKNEATQNNTTVTHPSQNKNTNMAETNMAPLGTTTRVMSTLSEERRAFWLDKAVREINFQHFWGSRRDFAEVSNDDFASPARFAALGPRHRSALETEAERLAANAAAVVAAYPPMPPDRRDFFLRTASTNIYMQHLCNKRTDFRGVPLDVLANPTRFAALGPRYREALEFEAEKIHLAEVAFNASWFPSDDQAVADDGQL